MAYPPRLFNCARCVCQVVICSHCDHGQIYCAGDCAGTARTESVRQSGQRYQASHNGQLKHAARQARYRERQRQKVTHHGSDRRSRHASLVRQLKWLLREITSNPIRPNSAIAAELTCHFCHQPCSPFSRWVFLSQFTSTAV